MNFRLFERETWHFNPKKETQQLKKIFVVSSLKCVSLQRCCTEFFKSQPLADKLIKQRSRSKGTVGPAELGSLFLLVDFVIVLWPMILQLDIKVCARTFVGPRRTLMTWAMLLINVMSAHWAEHRPLQNMDNNVPYGPLLFSCVAVCCISTKNNNLVRQLIVLHNTLNYKGLTTSF